MTKCTRCGLPSEGPDITGIGRCYARLGSYPGDLACRNRELANLRSLLRSVTGKLERTHDLLSSATLPLTDQQQALENIEAVLEVLS